MGLFGKKKKDTAPAVPEEETVEEQAPDLDNFDYDEDANETADEAASGTDSKFSGNDVLKALHRREELVQKAADTITGAAEKVGNYSIEKLSESLTEQRYGVRAKTIGFFGAGGGVGTSTVMLEVASRVAGAGKRVLVIDLNVMGGICETILCGASTVRKKSEDLYTLLSGHSDIEKTVITTKENGIVTLGFRNRGLDSVTSVDTSVYRKPYKNLILDVAVGYDFIFIDCGSDINFYLANNALYHVDAGYIVTDGGLSSMTKLGVLRTSFRYSGIVASRFGVIVNKNTRSVQDAVRKLNYRFACEIPYAVSIKDANLQGRLLKNNFAYTDAAYITGAKEAYDKIAQEIINPVIESFDEADAKQEMEFDKEAKAEAEAALSEEVAE